MQPRQRQRRKPKREPRSMRSGRDRPFPEGGRKQPTNLQKLDLPKATSSNARCLARSGRHCGHSSRRLPRKIRRFARKKFFEDFGLKVNLRWILVVTNSNRVGVIRAF